jgi:PAS domain S-box-containing protein
VGYDGQIYRELLADSGLAVVVHGPDGAVVEANQAFADMLGYTLTEALALTAAQVIHPRG